MNADDVLTAVRTGNQPVSTLIEGVKGFDITARIADASKSSVEAIRNIPLRASSGAVVPLGQVAEVSVAEGYSFVRREQLQRYAVIQMDVQGHDVDGFVKDANASIARELTLPPGMLLSSGVDAGPRRPPPSVAVGGLITWTLLSLMLLPVIYEWIESRKEKTS